VNPLKAFEGGWFEEGQAFEAEVIDVVGNAPDPDVADVTTREVPEGDGPCEYLADRWALNRQIRCTMKAFRFLENLANNRVPVIAAIEWRANVHSESCRELSMENGPDCFFKRNLVMSHRPG
jgi:hypothetical protein